MHTSILGVFQHIDAVCLNTNRLVDILWNQSDSTVVYSSDSGLKVVPLKKLSVESLNLNTEISKPNDRSVVCAIENKENMENHNSTTDKNISETMLSQQLLRVSQLKSTLNVVKGKNVSNNVLDQVNHLNLRVQAMEQELSELHVLFATFSSEVNSGMSNLMEIVKNLH